MTRIPSPPKRVLIGYNVHYELETYIRERRPDIELRGMRYLDVGDEDVAWAECYVGFRRPPKIAGWGSVRWVHCVGAGVDAFLFRNPIPRDVLLTRTDEPFGPQIAEWCVARALAETQHLFALYDAQKAGKWDQRWIGMLSGSEVLVVGTGEVGSAIARAFVALGCNVDGISRSGAARTPFRRVQTTDALAGAIGRYRYVILAMPLTEETHHMVSRDVLARGNGTYLMNVGRGALADESSLPEALDAGWIRGAALDVFEVEPLPESSPLWRRTDVVIAPHVAGLTTTEGAGDGFLACLACLERGELPRWAVDRAKGY